MAKKIAVIIERTNIVLGGAERSVFELSSALRLRGLEVHILAAKGQTDAKNLHVLCRNTEKRVEYSNFAEAIKKHLEQNHYDIVHSVLPFDFADVYQPRGGSFAETILRNAESYENKFIRKYKKLTAFMNRRRNTLLRAERRLCEKQNKVIVAALSQYVAEQFRKHYHLEDERIKIIANGVKVNKTVNKAEANKLRAQIMAQLHLRESNEPIFFLFVANNFRLKGLPCLIKAMQQITLSQTSRPAYLIIAGRGRYHKYRHLAKKLNVRNRTLFLGHLRHIQNAFSIADVAVLPTFYDPSSRFILEALATDKPVITTRFNGAADLFTDGRHGKIINEPRNIPALAQAMKYFCDSDNIKKTSEVIVKDNLKEQISIARVAEQLESLYNEILEKRRG